MRYTLDTKCQISVKYASWDVKAIRSNPAYAAVDRRWGIAFALPGCDDTCRKRTWPREQM